MHTLGWTPTQLMKLGSHGGYPGTFEWLHTYFLTLQAALVSWGKINSPKMKFLCKSPSHNPRTPGGSAHSRHNSLNPIATTGTEKPLEFSPWKIFCNELRSAVLRHLIFGSVQRINNSQLAWPHCMLTPVCFAHHCHGEVDRSATASPWCHKPKLVYSITEKRHHTWLCLKLILILDLHLYVVSMLFSCLIMSAVSIACY